MATSTQSHKSSASEEPTVAITAGALFYVWFLIGLQSFGGGAATLALIRQAVVERRNWLTPEQFSRYWGLVQVAPGINLFALTILIGKRVLGWRGVIIALAGLLLPSGAITVALTGLYARYEHARAMESVVRGVLPAVVGIAFVVGYRMVKPFLLECRREGRASVATASLIVAGGVATGFALRWPVVATLLISASLSAAVAWVRHRRLGAGR